VEEAEEPLQTMKLEEGDESLSKITRFKWLEPL
jgi:hypothetical protein